MEHETRVEVSVNDHADFGIVNLGTLESARIVLIEEMQDDMDVRTPLLKLPGGRKKGKELPAATVVREIYEELHGLVVNPKEIFFRQSMQGEHPHTFNVWTLAVPKKIGLEHLPVGDGVRKIVVLSEPLLASMLATGEIIAPVHSAALTRYLFLPSHAR